MKKQEKELFNLLDKKTKETFRKRFAKYYKKDSKPFINKISRDYEESGQFPVHILKQIKEIPKEKYDSAVCILRGALPYSILFQVEGWKMHYVLCGRRDADVSKKKRFNKSIDRSLSNIKGKKILLIDNNSPTGSTPIMVTNELKNAFDIKKPDLFLDYFFYYESQEDKITSWLKKAGPFWKTPTKLNKFSKVYEASKLKTSESEREKLVEEFLYKLNKNSKGANRKQKRKF